MQPGGRYHLMFQVCDMRRHALLEAHVRCYCVRREPDYTAVPGLEGFYCPHLMRLQQPDDELGGMLLLNLPNIIVHAVDSWSPLSPPVPPAASLPEHSDRSAVGGRFGEVPLRIADAEQGNRNSCGCPTCGECFDTVARLHQHLNYYYHEDKINQETSQHKHPPENCHPPPPPLPPSPPDPPPVAAGPTKEEVARWLEEGEVEVICLVEGIEPTTSYSVQSRHSYTAEDIVWDHTFAPTIFPADGRSRNQASPNPHCLRLWPAAMPWPIPNGKPRAVKLSQPPGVATNLTAACMCTNGRCCCIILVITLVASSTDRRPDRLHKISRPGAACDQ